MENNRKEMIEFILNNTDVADKCLRDLLRDVLTTIKELNAEKIDKDLEGIANGEDYTELFNDKEINAQLADYSQVLMILIKIARKGIETTFKELAEVEKDESIDDSITAYYKSIIDMYCEYVRIKANHPNENISNEEKAVN